MLDFQTHIFCKGKNIGPSFDPTTISKFSDTMVFGGFFCFVFLQLKESLSYPGLLRVLLYQHCGHCYTITCGSNLCTLLVWEALQSAKATFLKHFLCFCDIMILRQKGFFSPFLLPKVTLGLMALPCLPTLSRAVPIHSSANSLFHFSQIKLITPFL